MKHDNCDHEKTPSARAKCRKSQNGIARKGQSVTKTRTPKSWDNVPETDTWSKPKIRQEARRAAQKHQTENPLDIRSFSEIYKQFHHEFSELYG